MSETILETRVTKTRRHRYVKKNGLGSEYNTPLPIFNFLDQFYNFKIDPCAMKGDNWLGTPVRYTTEDDGLLQEWNGSAFVNPPYGYGNEEKWVKKAIEEYRKYNKPIFMLLPAKTEMKWFKYAMSAPVIIMLEGRVSFIQDGKPKRGNQIGSIIFGFCEHRANIDRSGAMGSLVNFNNEYQLGHQYKTDVQHWFYPSTQKIMEFCK